MFHRLFEGYSRHKSPVHRSPAWVKVLVATSLILAVVIPPPTLIGLSSVGLILILIIAMSRIPGLFLIRRLLLLEPFVIGVALLSLFQPGGWRMLLLIMTKCTLCLLTTILLANTTPMPEMIRVLKSIRAPSLLVTTLMLMYRYLFVLADEAQRMRRARASRTFTHGRWWQWRIAASVVGQLFSRAADRADRVWAAMCARGWR